MKILDRLSSCTFVAMISVFSFFLALVDSVSAEGSHSVSTDSSKIVRLRAGCSDSRGEFANPGAAEISRLKVRIADDTVESVYFGFNDNGSFSFQVREPGGTIVHGPFSVGPSSDNLSNGATGYNEAVAGPDVVDPINGYDTSNSNYVFNPADGAGDYYVEFLACSVIEIFDISVVSSVGPTRIDGRVSSGSWYFDAISDDINGTFYIYDGNQFVTEIDFGGAGFQPFYAVLSFNSTGPSNTGDIVEDRKSIVTENGNPEYPAFINIPDPTQYPEGPVGTLLNLPLKKIPGSSNFDVEVNATGVVEAVLDFDSDGAFTDGRDVILAEPVVPGLNTFTWNGEDANGVVQNTADVAVILNFNQGITHFTKVDAEQLSGGFAIRRIRPTPVEARLQFYDDTLIEAEGFDPDSNSATNEVGFNFVGSATRQVWTNTDYGDIHTINTWWVAVVDSATTLILDEDLDNDNDGIPDLLECTTTPCEDTDGDGVPDVQDLDSDNDGIPDSIESGSVDLDLDRDGVIDTVADSDGDLVPNTCDVDFTSGSDSAPGPDNIDDICQGGPDADGDGIQDESDSDADGDGLADVVDADAGGQAVIPINTDGLGNEDFREVDSDGDGVFDSVEADVVGDVNGNGIVDSYEDDDNDGVPDGCDVDITFGDDLSPVDGIDDSCQGGIDTDEDGIQDSSDSDLDGDGFADDGNPATGGEAVPLTDTDNDGVPDYQELDSDNDGIPDVLECSSSVCEDTDQDGLPDYRDLDSDNDGIPDSVEAGSGEDLDRDGVIDSIQDSDGDGIPNSCDVDQTSNVDVSPVDGIDDTCQGGPDSDNDGIQDSSDPDVDGNGLADVVDAGAGGSGVVPPDSDGDEIPDFRDVDSDNDGITDATEAGGIDVDGDGIYDCSTSEGTNGLCPDTDPANGGESLPDPDTDRDGIEDRLDLDSDNDGIADIIEAGGQDIDGDGRIDNFIDVDTDGLADSVDPDDNTTPAVSDGSGEPLPLPNSDSDGLPDYRDLDSDNDGLTDILEAGGADLDGDGVVDDFIDADGDGYDDKYDTDDDTVAGSGDGVGTKLPVPDFDDDSVPDYLDQDSDNDGVSDAAEGSDADSDGDGEVDNFVDADGDGYDDRFDTDNSNTSELGDGGGTPAIDPDTDDDNVPDRYDADSDNDGIPDTIEAGGVGVDTNGDGVVDCSSLPDFGESGYCPDLDPADGGTPVDDRDSDGDGTPDRQELDSDNDNIPDTFEAGILDENEDGLVDCSSSFGADGFCPEVDPKDGGVAVSPADSDGDGIPDFQEPGALQSPVYSVWNSFYEQENVVSMRNASQDEVVVEFTLFDIDGLQLSSQNINVAANSSFDVSVNALPGYDTSSYGYLKLVFEPATGFDAQMNLYRLTPDATDLEFGIVKSFENIARGKTYALFNTIQPSYDPQQLMNWLPQWTQIVNLDPLNQQVFTYNLYDQVGNLLFTEDVTIPPMGRRDSQAGHVLGNGLVGLVEILPASDSVDYIAQLFYYSQDAEPQFKPETFSFALGTEARAGSKSDHYLTVSRGAGGQSWVTVANNSDMPANVAVKFSNSIGQVENITATIEAKGQRHFLADDFLAEGETGFAVVSSTNMQEVISETRTYFRNELGQVTAAYVVPGRERPDRSVMASPYNYFFNALNWIRLHNPESTDENVTVVVYDQLGDVLGSVPVTVAAGATTDMEVRASLGIDIDDNTIGLVTIVPENPGRVFGDVLRVKTVSDNPTAIDFSKPISFR